MVSALSFFLLFPLGPPAPAVLVFEFFLSNLAKLSASHGAFTPPRDAFLLLCHSAAPASPAISAIVLPLKTDLSYLSMSNPGTAYSSFFLMSNHSVPLLPGRRAFM